MSLSSLICADAERTDSTSLSKIILKDGCQAVLSIEIQSSKKKIKIKPKVKV